jgi:hypothetical protein
MNDDVFGEFIYKRTYARWLDGEQRREDWGETVLRYRSYFLDRFDLPEEMEGKFNHACDMILNKEIVPSMRAMWTAGAALDEDNMSGFNCTFLLIDSVKSFADMLYLLMNGCGVGYSVERQVIVQLPEIPEELVSSAHAVVFADSKLGWAEGLLEYMTRIYDGEIPEYDLSLIRPKGARLKTFGGKAGGSDDLKLLLDYIKNVFHKAHGRRLTSIECHDICCFIANVVVSAGIRRSACISLSNLSDPRMRDCKVGEFWLTNPQRSMANNSAAYTEKPDMHIFMQEWMSLMNSGSGERGIFNRESSKKQFDKLGRSTVDSDGNEHIIGTNPCVTGDTMLLTDEGHFPIRNLAHSEVSIWNGSEFSDVIPFSTGDNPIYHVEMSNGVSIDCTGYHEWMVTDGRPRSNKVDRVETADLKRGDKLVKYTMPVIDVGKEHPVNEMYSLGFHAGDGNEGCDFSWLYDTKYCCQHRLIGDILMDGDGTRNRKRWKHGYIQNKFMVPINGTVHNKLEWFAGILDSDGCIIRNPNSAGLQISSINHKFLVDIRLMLTTLGVQCKIVCGRAMQERDMPDGRDGNKVYMCKADERINISASDVANLVDIGLHCSRLELSEHTPNRNASRFVTVVSVEKTGHSEETFCVTETKNHTATFNGIVTGQCGEILLRPNEACNLSEVIVRPEDTLNTLIDKVESATVIGCMQSCLTSTKFLDPIWKKNMEEERLLGVSLTGVRDHPILNRVSQLSSMWLTTLRSAAHAMAAECAAVLEINVPIAITCNKPSGTVSALLNTASGVHTRFSPYYIRRVRVSTTDVLYKFLMSVGVPSHPEVGQDADTANTWVFNFPIKAPDGAIFDTPALEQLGYWRMFKTCWTDHNPSVTITVEEHEWMEVGSFVYKNWDIVGGLSFLPKSDNVYQLMPFEAITEEEYDQLMSEMPDINFDDLTKFERDDETTGSHEFACVGGNCEVI